MQLLQYDIDKQVRAFSTIRGEGSGNYGGFNITHYCGDDPQHVAECREELCRYLSIDNSRLILPRQTHGSEVHCIDEAFTALTESEQQTLLHGIDAIVTSLHRVCIGVSTADCIPILLYDTKKEVVAAIHAVWRGTVARITDRCIGTMKERYGSTCSDIRAVIAPGISIEAFEVGNEVLEEFTKAGFLAEDIATLYPSAEGEKWHIDLWKANHLQLTQAGVPQENIQTAGICTYKECDKFFSARRLGINSGRIFNGIMIL